MLFSMKAIKLFVLVTVVLCATLVYELIGPLLTKMSLIKAGEIPNDKGIHTYENEIKN